MWCYKGEVIDNLTAGRSIAQCFVRRTNIFQRRRGVRAFELAHVAYSGALQAPNHVDIDCAPAKRRRLNLVANELFVQAPRRLCTDKVPYVSDDVTSSRIRPDLPDSF